MYQKILLVDDEPISLRVLSEYLEEEGYRVDVAHHGREALTKLENYPHAYAAVIVDRLMPYMSGLDLLKVMQSNNKLKDIPVIMLTGAGEKEDILDAVNAGVFDYLTKPIEKPLLLKLIVRALSHSKQ